MIRSLCLAAMAIGAALLQPLLPPEKSIRLLGLGLSSLGESAAAALAPEQLALV